MAVDGDGNAVNWNGSSWSTATPIDGPNPHGLKSVSCPSESFCVVVDDGGSAILSTTLPAATTTLTLSKSKVTYGDEQVEKLSVTVGPVQGVITPTGTVTITDSVTTLCTITLSKSAGSCSLSATKLRAGTYSLMAVSKGSAASAPSYSAQVLLIVAKATSRRLSHCLQPRSPTGTSRSRNSRSRSPRSTKARPRRHGGGHRLHNHVVRDHLVEGQGFVQVDGQATSGRHVRSRRHLRP